MPKVKLVCPYTRLLDQVLAAISPWHPELVRMEKDDSYFHLLRRLWAAGETVIINEHDIVPWDGALEELWDCPEEWCAFLYDFLGTQLAGLGCTKFAGELMRRVPDAVRNTSTEETELHPRNHWCNLDDRLSRQLSLAGR